MYRARLTAALVAVAALTAACGSDSGTAVTVIADVRFADASPDLSAWSEPLMDVYTPPDARGLPLVVVLTPHGFTKEDSAAAGQLASAVAARGAVVVVANWTPLDDPPEAYTDPAVFRAISSAGQSFAGCAVSYAVAHADEYGADPSRLVLVGELFGANTASMVALGAPEPFPQCRATAAWSATGLVGVNDDWLVAYPQLDGVATAAAETLSPWMLLPEAPKVSTALVVSADGIEVSGRCDDRDAAWMVARDPTGAMRAQLDAVGAYSDGCVDLLDEAAAMAAEMVARGLGAEVVQIANPDGGTKSDPGAHALTWGPADLTVLADTVMKIASA